MKHCCVAHCTGNNSIEQSGAVPLFFLNLYCGNADEESHFKNNGAYANASQNNW